ncbi:MAG: septal ring lytic transglycosylase RlpA family protein [Cytophagales bacterium]|nr:MAG: septal ring lytic transglycosylase RlpA family protein [Cytophagales bacterium]
MNFRLIVFLFFISFSNSYLLFGQEIRNGYASYYGREFQGRKTASGEKYDYKQLTGAHRSFPFGTFVKVTRTDNKKYVVVRINDRGPFSKKRIIDVSRSAAEKLDMVLDGITMVSIEVVDGKYYSDSTDLDETSHKIQEKPSIVNRDSAIVLLGKPNWEELSVSNIYNIDGKKQTVKGYGIQILSLGDLNKLSKEVDTLLSKGFKTIFIEPAKIGDKRSYRILIGAYPDANKAKEDKIKLELLGYNGFLKKYIITSK